MPWDWGEVKNGKKNVIRIRVFPDETEHHIPGVAAVHPFEPAKVEIGLVKCCFLTVQSV